MGCEQDLIVRPIQKALMGCKPEHARQDDNAICSLTLMKTVGPLEAHKQSQSQNKSYPTWGSRVLNKHAGPVHVCVQPLQSYWLLLPGKHNLGAS